MAEPGTTVGTWLYDIIGTQVRRGDELFPRRRYLEIVGGATISDDPVRNATKLTLTVGGGGVGSDRLLLGTAPIRIDGGASADLSADRTISILDATTTTVGAVKLAADLGGTGLLPEVLKIHGATVPAAGALVPGNVLQVSAVAALVYAAVNLAGGANYVTGRLPIANVAFDNPDTVLTTNAAGNATQYRKLVDANIDAAANIAVSKLNPGATPGFVLTNVGGVATWATPSTTPGSITPGTARQLFTSTNAPASDWVTVTGDVTIPVTPGAMVVGAIRGAAVGTAAGALTPGTVLRAVTDSTIDYGAVALNNEAAVAGALAIAHIAPHTSPTAILITNGAGATEWSTTIPGGVFPALAGNVTGSPGANLVERIRNTVVTTAAGTLVAGQALRVTDPSTADWGPTDLANENAITNKLGLPHLAQGGAIANNILVNNGTNWVPGVVPPGSLTLTGDANGLASANTVDGLHGVANVVAMHGDAITWDVGSTPLLQQLARTTDVAPHDFTIRAQAPFAGSSLANRNASNIVFEVPVPAAGGADGYHKFSTSGSVRGALGNALFPSGVGGVNAGALWLGEVASAPTADNYTLSSNGLGLVRINVPDSGAFSVFQLYLSGIESHAWTHGIFGFGEFNPLANNVAFQQVSRSTDAPTHDMYLIPQSAFPGATGTNRDAASVIFAIPDEVAGGVPGGFGIEFGARDYEFKKGRIRLFGMESAGGDINNAPSWTAGTAIPTASEVDGSRYTRMGAPNGDEYLRRNGAWVSVLTGGSVTLAGDVTGSSGANVVEKLTGVGGVVSVVASELRGAGPATLSAADNVGPGYTVTIKGGTGSTNGGEVRIIGGTGATSAVVYIQPSSLLSGIEVSDAGILLGLTTLQFGATVASPLFNQVRAVGDVPAQDLSVAPQTPSLTATGTNRDSPNLVLGIPTPVGGGATGAIEFRISGTPVVYVVGGAAFGVQFDSAITPVINQATIAGTPHVLTLQSQASTTTKGGTLSLVTGTGAGGSHGDMTFMTGARPAFTLFDASFPIFHWYTDALRIDKSVPSPVFFQQARDTDIACTNLTIRSQAPYSGAATNKIPGNLIYEIPSPAAGGDPPGWHSFKVSDVEYVNITTTKVTLNTGIFYTAAYLNGSSPSIYCETMPTPNTAGDSLDIEGQRGGSGNSNGGPVLITGGAGVGGGASGFVRLALNGIAATSVAVVAKDTTRGAVVLNASGSFSAATDLPTNMTSYVFLGDEAGVPSSNPVGGCVIASVGGRFYTLTSAGVDFMIEGTSSVSAGSVVEYMEVQYGGNVRKIAMLAAA